MRWQLTDHIDQFEPWSRITGRKAVSLEEAYLLERFGVHGYAPEAIVVYGRSLGGAVATHVASEHDVAAMALETPFTDLYELATDLYPFPMPQSLFEYSFDNKNRAPQIDVPTWVVHGTEDRIVPVDHGRRVFQALSNGWKMTIIEGGGHNDLMGFEEHGRDLALFFDHVLD